MLVRTHGALCDGSVRLFRTRDVSQKYAANSTLHEWGMGWPRIVFWWSARLFRSGRTPGMTRFVVNGGACLRNARQGTCMYRVVHTVGCSKRGAPYAE